MGAVQEAKTFWTALFLDQCPLRNDVPAKVASTATFVVEKAFQDDFSDISF